MIDLIMIRWGLPVMPGVVAMLGVSVLARLFLAEPVWRSPKTAFYNPWGKV